MNNYILGHKIITDEEWSNSYVGTNLLIGSHDFSGSTWHVPNTVDMKKDSIGNIASMTIKNDWEGTSPIMSVKAKNWYTLSFNLKVTDWTDGDIFLYSATGVQYDDFCTDTDSYSVTIGNSTLNQKREQSGVILTDYIKNNNLIGKEIRVVFKFFAVKDGNLLARIESDKKALTYLTSSYKLEYGSIATQWSPAPQDLALQSDVTSLQDQINQLKSKMGG